ncbi:hypothetical protein Ciccas_008584 [Cichlidogyrus casuarinus]|uniref:Aurora kinase n=1 Tax=Cichlidogyrus casuarinus TaxID=1844966 RepID=A0ABD2PZH3_9PLAT
METSPIRSSQRKSDILPSNFEPDKLKIIAGGVLQEEGNSMGCEKLNSSAKKWKLADFDIGRCLGKGSFGSVYLAREKVSRFIFSLKILYKSSFTSPDSMQQLCREIDIQFHLRHPNIVQLFSYFYDHKRIYLMFEYVPKGHLEDELKKFQYFTHIRAASYLYQLASAINYFHNKHIIHRDIKATNVLIGSKGEVKITDFGQSIHRPSSNRNKFVGTIEYIPPEIALCTEDNVSNTPYDQSVDIWSLGILTFFMLTGELPFAKFDLATTMKHIQTGQIVIPERIGSEASTIIRAMLQYDPKRRLNAEQLIAHRWVVNNSEKDLSRCQSALNDWEAIKLHHPTSKENTLSFSSCSISFNSSNSNN